jgi:sugar phosphate permease
MPFDDASHGSAQSLSATVANRPDMRKRWWVIIPAVFITYSLAYVDRANYGFGAAAGLADELHITSSQSALLGSLFFFGYFLFQIPGAAYARKRSARLLIALALCTWGVLATLTGVIRSYPLLAIDRLLLGAAESFILPGMLILLTKWFTRAERSRANTVLLLGNPVTVLWMSAITGYIIRAFGWQMTFIIEGLPSVIWGFLWYTIIRDRPQDAHWTTSESRLELNMVLAAEQSTLPVVPNMAAALRNPNVILLSLQYLLWSIGVYGFVLWLPVMVHKGSAASMGVTGLLSAIPYAASIVLMLINSYFSDRASSRSRFVWPYLLLAGAAFFGSYLAADHNFWIAFGFLIIAGGCMYAPYGPFFAIIPEMLPANVAGEVTALINSMGALGSFLGSYLVGYLQGATGSSKAGYLLMSLSLLLSSVLILVLRPVKAAAPAEYAVE